MASFDSIMSVRFIHVDEFNSDLIILIVCSIPLCECASFLIHPTIVGYLSCFQFGVIMNNAAVNIFVYNPGYMYVHAFLWVYTWKWSCWVIG